MKTKGVLISSAVGLMAVTAVAATSLSISAAAETEGARMAPAKAMFGGHHGWRHGGRHGGGPMTHLCGMARGEKIQRAISFVDNFMSFTPPQQQAWDDLARTLRAGNDRIGTACDTLKDGKAPESAPAKLTMTEDFLTAALDVVRQVRPAFDRFYGTLNAKQRKALDDLLSRRHRG